jgi:hypothetical protein
MKVQLILVSLLCMSHWGLAAPVMNEDVSLATLSQDLSDDELHSIAIRTPNEAHTAKIHLENRASVAAH